MKTWDLVLSKLSGKKTWTGIVLYALGAAVRGIGAVSGLPVEATAAWFEGTGILLMGVGAADKLRKGA